MPFKAENGALTIPKHRIKYFEKVHKTNLLTPKTVKNGPLNSRSGSNFVRRSSFLGLIYYPLELKIQPKVKLTI